MSKSYPRDLPPVWLLLTVSAMVALHLWWPVDIVIRDPWRGIGWLPMGLGVWAVVHNAYRFMRSQTGLRPFTEATLLVTDGAFRLTRNPMYVGLVAIAVGVAIRLGSLSPMPLPVVLFFVLDRRFIRPEEQFLREALGTPYDDYCRRVRRWL